MLTNMHIYRAACTHTHKHGHTHTQIVIGSCVSLTVGVVSSVDTSLTHLSLTWRSRQHFASVTHKRWQTHFQTYTHTHTHIFHAILATMVSQILMFSWCFVSFISGCRLQWGLHLEVRNGVIVSPKLKPPRRAFSRGWGGEEERGGPGCDILNGAREGSRYRMALRAGAAV